LWWALEFQRPPQSCRQSNWNNPAFASCTRAFKFLALGKVSSGQIVAIPVGIMPFSGLSTSTSAKNLKSQIKHVNQGRFQAYFRAEISTRFVE
jgi:hypothetical protein